MQGKKSPLPLQSHEVEEVIDDIVDIIWKAHEEKRIEFIHVTIGLHRDGKQIRVSFPKKERE